jgi:hypothetical protein
LELVKQAIYATPAKSYDMFNKANILYDNVDEILFEFNGEKPKASVEEIPPTSVTIKSRLETLLYTNWRAITDITQNQKTAYDILTKRIRKIQKRLLEISENELKKLEAEMDEKNAPWTPGRMPVLKEIL